MKKAFTLVELLAVIVILAVILVIAVPKITDTIEASKKSSLESSTKLVASTIETDYQGAQAVGTTFATSGSCIAYVDSNEYSACTYTITDGVASVTLSGKDGSKFDGLTASGTKNDASIVTLPTAKANFAAYTWSEIQTLAHAASIGDITYAELSSTYNLAVGQTRCIDLTGFTTKNGNSCGTSGTAHSGFSVRISNMSNGEDNTCGTTGFSETACGFVIEFVDIITTYNMYLSYTYPADWSNSSMHTYVNNTIYNALPSDLKSVISDTTVVSGSTYKISDSKPTDKLFLLSSHEVWSSTYLDYYDAAFDSTRQLDYYKNKGVTSESNRSYAVKQKNGSNDTWGLRSACFESEDDEFLAVENNGSWYASSNNGVNGVSPAFRIS